MESLRWLAEHINKLRFIIIRLVLALAFFVVFVYYPVGMIWVHEVDDSPTYSSGKYDIKGGSKAIAICSALIDREIRIHSWTPNDPVFMPGYMLDRMPAFQRGVIAGISRFAIEMADQIGRTRGSSQVDPDLEKAAGLLKYSPYVWVFDFSTSLLPTASSEQQYEGALKALVNYNQRLARSEAVFDRRADNLMETLSRVASDLGSSSALLDNQIHNNAGRYIDNTADETFYFVKGRLYANYMILKALGEDFKDVIAEKQLHSTWKQTLETFEEASRLSNFFIFNAKPDSQFMPNHLAIQGFYLLRARTQLYEISNILLK